jgi:hypothetical protein
MDDGKLWTTTPHNLHCVPACKWNHPNKSSGLRGFTQSQEQQITTSAAQQLSDVALAPLAAVLPAVESLLRPPGTESCQDVSVSWHLISVESPHIAWHDSFLPRKCRERGNKVVDVSKCVKANAESMCLKPAEANTCCLNFHSEMVWVVCCDQCGSP